MELDLDCVVDNLYVGGIQATRNPKLLYELGVTHVVTVSDSPANNIAESGLFKYKFVQGMDIEITDLLAHFSDVNAFIDEGVKSGATLVHCIAGVSRSVTMVIAYLMEKKGMKFEDALTLVQQKRKYAYPNEGFVKQLKLYEAMKCKLDPTNEEYRSHRLASLAFTMQEGNQSKDVFLPGDLAENPTANKVDIIFKCKKCRQPLFKKSSFIIHTEGPGGMAFDWRGSAAQDSAGDTTPRKICEKSIFIKPVEWMKESIVSSQGKLSCPKCNSKLGSFVWHGERCSCGEWIVPAFHIQTSKVDECKPILNINKPPKDVQSENIPNT